MTPDSVLVLTQDAAAGRAIEDHLASRATFVTVVPDSTSALHALARRRYSLIVADVRLPEGETEAFLQSIALRPPPRPFVFLADPAHLPEAFQRAAATEALDCLAVPIAVGQLDLVMSRIRLMSRLQHTAQAMNDSDINSATLLGETAVMQDLQRLIRQVGPTDATVLIEGEPGTGRRLVARLLHRESRRASSPFFAIDCAATAPERIESDLFGEAAGVGGLPRPGRIVLAEGGTVLLQEISACPAAVQARLLKWLEDAAAESTTVAQPDTRLMATTSRSLEKLAARHQFRPELFYRLNVLPLRVPPLRERREDVPLLAAHFLARQARRLGRTGPEMSEACLQVLQRHDWPGNVRELRLVIEGAVMRCQGAVLGPEHLTPRLRLRESAPVPEAPPAFDESGQYLTLAEIEKRHILATLDHFQGNRTSTARSLDISIRTLRNKLVEYRAAGIKIPGGYASAA